MAATAMTIKVVVTTYVPEVGHPRGQYLRTSLGHLRNHLLSPEDHHFVVAHDGDSAHPDVVRVVDTMLGIHYPHTVTGGPRVGIGGSLNRALTCVDSDDLWMYTTDDWRLDEDYDITRAVRLIRELGYDYVRLGPPHPNVMCQIKFHQPIGWWLDLWPKGGYFAFATRPFVATRQFYEKVGSFKENCDAFVCERDYADRVCDLWHNLQLAEIVSGSFEGPWEHIGEVEVGDKFP